MATGIEVVSETWKLNAYALIPIGEAEQKLNSSAQGGLLYTCGLDIGYGLTDKLNNPIGYYYEQ